MKLLEKERVVAPKAPTRRARALVAPRLVERPTVVLRTRSAARPSLRRNAALSDATGRLVVFAAIVGLTYVGSTLGGYVMLERARQTARHGIQRAAFARAEAKQARASIEALTNPADLNAWATVHGFVPGQATGLHGSGLVAQR